MGVPFFFGGGSAFLVENSLSLNGTDEWMDITPGSAGDRTAWTYNEFIYLASGFGGAEIFSAGADSSNKTEISITSGGGINFEQVTGASAEGRRRVADSTIVAETWYQLTFWWDSDNGTAGDRMRVWVDQTEITSFTTEVAVDSGRQSFINNNQNHTLGKRPYASNNYFEGYRCQPSFIDGSLVSPSDFASGGLPSDLSGLTFGSNGLWLPFDTDSDLGNDISGNNNDFSLNNIDSSNQSGEVPSA